MPMKASSSIAMGLVIAGSIVGASAAPAQRGNPVAGQSAAVSVTVKESAQNLNNLAAELYEQASLSDKGNLFFSPYSIQTALGMAYAGARDQTATEMASTLHFVAGQETPARLSELQQLLNGELKGGNTLDTANGLWVASRLKLLDGFNTIMQSDYSGASHTVEAFNETVRGQINGWVEQKTRNKIKDLIPPGGVNEMTRLVLANAIYFKGSWLNKFEPARTHEMDFHAAGGKTIKVQMMAQNKKFAFSQDNSVQVLEMPYEGDELAMVVVLPRAQNGIENLQVTPDAVRRWCESRGARPEVNVSLPKFKIAWKSEMSGLLSKMGMPTAFTDAADFSGIDGQKDLYISKVFHKAWVEVDEKGTEAAAATGVGISTMAVMQPAVFNADHPFLFLIRDKRSGAILFMGRVTEPTQASE
jgi:serine protease inhibitor